MPTADMSPHAVGVGTKQKRYRYAAFFNSFFTIAFAVLAGMRLDRCIHYFRTEKNDWQLEAFMAVAYLVFSVVWMTRLRAKWGTGNKT